MDEKQVQVGRRRTSDGPAHVTRASRRLLRRSEAVDEDEIIPKSDPHWGRLASDSQRASQHGSRTELNEKVNASAGRLAEEVGKVGTLCNKRTPRG